VREEGGKRKRSNVPAFVNTPMHRNDPRCGYHSVIITDAAGFGKWKPSQRLNTVASDPWDHLRSWMGRVSTTMQHTESRKGFVSVARGMAVCLTVVAVVLGRRISALHIPVSVNARTMSRGGIILSVMAVAVILQASFHCTSGHIFAAGGDGGHRVRICSAPSNNTVAIG
jgi:hypothetical protein